jgi:DnaK suppressor protein
MRFTDNKTLPTISFGRKDAEYMSPGMQAYFQHRLLSWREELQEKLSHKLNIVQVDTAVTDDIEAATREIMMQQEVQTMHSDQRLVVEVEDALKRLEEGRYGYCEITDAEIGFKRLEAWPIARLCIEMQEKVEEDLY